jgi:tetratricopeptide (TPR) repeat protein/tRNA A-37 threonylcarbamoyl transferase component Bud32
LWDEGRPPDVAEFLAQAGPLSQDQVAVLLRVDQRGRWRAGDPVPAEVYLQRHPAVAADPDSAVDVIFNEILLREENGDRPDPDEYLRRFPDYADLLRAQIELHRAMAASAGDCAVTVRAAVSDTATGEGRASPGLPGYELLGELGRGGMGVVYKARQASLNRIVALKMLLGGAYADPEQHRRLQIEAEAVARLRHPNIVQIFEVGEYDGRPYLVLEYVEGGSLDAQLHGTPQNPRVAAALTETLARAVHAAHQQGVVHRDLKPANVLLQIDQQQSAIGNLQSAIPKVSDFGLAKQLDAGPGRTPSEAIVGTPSYMAPEQASGKTRLVGPAADVYALGAILYEMLTGRPPFRGETPLDTLQQVVVDDPVPPRDLQPKVPTDLATVCLKCLQKDPNRRYGSAGELADDLHHFLAGEPIKARPVGPAARFYRWCRRKPALAGLLALLVVGTAVSTWQAVRATLAERERDRQRLAAEEEADNARAVLDFLNESVLGQASAYKQAGSGAAPDPDLKVRTALDRAAAGLGGRFDGRPRVEAAVRTALGSAYFDVGAFEAARTQLEEAVRLDRDTRGEDHPDTLKATTLLARACLGQGKYDEAEAFFTRARDGYVRRYGEEQPETLIARSNLATAAHARGDLDRAEAIYLEVLEKQRRTRGEEHPDTLATIGNLALLYKTRGKYGEAEQLLTGNVEAYRKAFGEEHPDTLHARRDLAATYQEEGQNEKALPLLRDAFEATRRAFGDENDETCTARNNLATCYVALRRLDEAEPLYEHNLEVQRRVLGDDNPHTLGTMGGLGGVYFERGDYARAETLCARSLAILRRTTPADSPDLLLAVNNLATLYYRQRKFAEAVPLFEEALAGYRKVLGEQHPHTLLILSNLATMYVVWGKDDKAEPLFEQERKVRVSQPGGTEDPKTASVLASLGRIKLRRKQPDEAEPLLRESLRIFKKQKSESYVYFHAQTLVGECLTAQGKYPEAEPLLLAGHEGMLRRANEMRPGNNSLTDAGQRVVHLYEAWGKPEKVAEWRAKLASPPGR